MGSYLVEQKFICLFVCLLSTLLTLLPLQCSSLINSKGLSQWIQMMHMTHIKVGKGTTACRSLSRYSINNFTTLSQSVRTSKYFRTTDKMSLKTLSKSSCYCTKQLGHWLTVLIHLRYWMFLGSDYCLLKFCIFFLCPNKFFSHMLWFLFL